jgi:2-haloacid dehalogenase
MTSYAPQARLHRPPRYGVYIMRRMPRLQVVVFDVNETLSDMAPLAMRFKELGAREMAARVWFASLLRDGFSLAAVGASERFAIIGRTLLREVLAGEALDGDLDRAVESIMSAFMQLGLHPDVPEGIRALRDIGLRLVTLTNGSTEVAEGLLERADLRRHFERLLSVEDAGIWKPALGAYAHAARACQVRPDEMLLVASHPWDVDGAGRAGMATAWLNRSANRYPAYFRPADHEVAALPQLAARLGAAS